MAEDEGTIPNPYKHALRDALPQAEDHARTIRSALNAASTALMAGAWQSTTADDFGGALSDHRRTLQSVATAEADEFHDEISQQPDEVEPNSWQANWARIARNALP